MIEETNNGIDNFIYSFTQKYMVEISKHYDEEIIKSMVQYAKENDIHLMLLDEELVKEIIELGVKEYLKRQYDPQEIRKGGK